MRPILAIALLFACKADPTPSEPVRLVQPDATPWGVGLELDLSQNDGVTGYAECLGTVLECAVDATPLDTCVRTVRTCKTNKPWSEGRSCCPRDCVTAYESRGGGIDAFMATFVDDTSCFPGLEEAQ